MGAGLARGKWIAIFAALSGICAVPSALAQANAPEARKSVDAFMRKRTLDVVIEHRPVSCDPGREACYSNHFRKLRWYQHDEPKHVCRTAMLPVKHRLPYRLSDEGEVPFAPMAVFARIAAPQDAWIDWRGVTRIERTGKVVRAYAPLNAYRVNFTFAKDADANAAAARFEAFRSACADADAPITNLLQAYRVSLKTIQASVTGLRTGFTGEAYRAHRERQYQGASIAFFRQGMCEWGDLGGLYQEKYFSISFPDLKLASEITQNQKTVRIHTADARYYIELDLTNESDAQLLVNSLKFVANWCRTEYSPTKFYPKVW